jgi:serine/threonine-protein kinase RsbW
MDALTVPGTLASLGPIAGYVRAATGAAGLDTKAAYWLRMAADEIATNIFTYGCRGTVASVVIRAETDDEWIRIVIEDGTPPFDPRSVPPPGDLDAPIEDRSEGGLGLFMALRKLDAFDYQRVGATNRSILAMRRSRP